MLEVTQLHPDFGAQLSGVGLSEPVDEAVVEAVLAAIDRYSFVCFPAQFLDDAQQLSFTRCLGEPEPNHVILGQEGRIDYFGTIGNVLADGSSIGNDHKYSIFLTGNNLWHSDSSFREVPSRFSIMSVHEVPDAGGWTYFASQRAAYGRLPAATQARIDPLVTVHDYVFSRSKVSPDAVTPSHAASLPPVHQKLVRRNPRSGEKNYFVGSHAKEIVGWDFADSRALLDELLELATADEHVYTHQWRPGDLVVWDNRCLLHRGCGYDADKYRRLMRQTRVAGSGSSLNE